MKRRSEKDVSWEQNVNKIIGLGSKSIRKSYYPELKEKITSLDRQNVFYQSVLNSIPDGVVITDSSGVILQVNPALVDLFFYNTRELTGKHISMLYFDDLNDVLDDSLWTDKARNYRRKDGSKLIGEAHSNEIHDKTGSIIGNIEVIRDISERIETIRQQRRLEEQLLKSQKMEAIGSLAGGIAHDFNNILSGIIGYAELVEIFKLTDIDEIRHNIKEILQASYRARDLVKQILTFSRGGDQEDVLIPLTSVVRESLQLIRASLPSNIDLKTQFETSVDTVLGDPTQLHQVITNLCTNSIYAMKGNGGTLCLQISEVEVPGHYSPQSNGAFPEKMLQLEVADTGYGIPKEVLDHIFEPYFTTKRSGEGTGFGLALVHGIVKSHNGYIEVDSREGIGTCFRIIFPQRTEEKQAPDDEKQILLSGGTGNVLLVDDEVQQLEWGSRFLDRLGFTVTTVQSGKEAIDRFESTPLAFDVVITDQMMPGMTGIELSMRIRSIRNDIPIILCTGVSHTLSMEKIRSVGINKIVNKPYSLAELSGILQQL